MYVVKVFVGSENDLPFTTEGLAHLKSRGVKYTVNVASIHRTPSRTSKLLKAAIKSPRTAVIIGGSASSTGLPGVSAGFVEEHRSDILVLGVRFDNDAGERLIQDASFGISQMPRGVPLGHTGYNTKGFLHACMLAAKVVKMLEKK